MNSVLILGGTSAIAQSFCRQSLAPTAEFFLIGRNQERLETVAADLRARGAASVGVACIGSGDYPSLQAAVAAAFRHIKVDTFVAAQGCLPENEAGEQDPQTIASLFMANSVEVIQATLLVANHFEARRSGKIALLSSVAGDRGRRSNYLYGASKAALDVFAEGLRQRLSPHCHVLLVKPGPVDTPMTRHLRKSALFSTPDRVARLIARGLRRGKNRIYCPAYWRWLMLVIKLMPAGLVKRLKA